MKLQRLQSKANLDNFIIQDGDIDRSYDPLKSPPGGLAWTLCVINITDAEYEYAALSEQGGSYGKWFRIPVTGKTCQTDYDECLRTGGWKVILSLPRATAPFDLRLATGRDEIGNATGAEFLGIEPDGAYDGGVVGIDLLF
ncbi:hypothetical protein [Labrys neptuniae]